MKLCTIDFYLFDPDSSPVIVLVMIGLYAGMLLFWIISSIRIIPKVELRDEFVLIPMMITLGITLSFRIVYFMGGIDPFCFPKYWYFFFNDIASLSKDVCLLCLLIRVWDYLGSLDSEENTYEFTKKYTYIFMVAHILLAYSIIILEESEILTNNLAQYLGGIEIVMFFVFCYGFYKLFLTIRQNPDSNIEREVLVMNGTSVVIIITILFRIVFNLYINNPVPQEHGANLVIFFFSILSEFVPCGLIPLILFLQQESLTGSVLRGISFSRNVP